MDQSFALIFTQRSVGMITLTIVGVIIVVSILLSKPRTVSSKTLLAFFSLLTFSFLLAVVPIDQDVYILYPLLTILTLTETGLLAQFAYTFPERKASRESKIVLWVYIVGILFTFSLSVYLIVNFFTFLPKPAWLYTLLFASLPGYLLLTIALFFRQALVTHSRTMTIYALSMLFVFPSIAYPLFKFSVVNSGSALELIVIIIVLITMISMYLAYLERRMEPVSLSLKLVSVTLCGFLLLCGTAGILVSQWLGDSYEEERLMEAAYIMQNAETGNMLNQAPQGIIYILEMPMNAQITSDEVNVLFSRSENVPAYLSQLNPMTENENFQFSALRAKNPLAGSYILIEKILYYPTGVRQLSPAIAAYRFQTQDKTYEIGYPFQYYSRKTNEAMKNLITLILGGSILLVLLFLLYYDSFLIKPIHAILRGIRQAKQGEKDVFIPVFTEDEVGFLARSFNDFFGVIQDTQQDLKEANQNLEIRVEERTSDLELLRLVATSLNQSVTIEEALQTGLQTVMSLLNAKSGWIYLLGEDQSVKLGVAYNLPGEETIHERLRDSNSCVCITRLKNGGFNHAAFIHDCPYLAGHLSIPLQAGNIAYGTLNLLLPAEKQISENEIRLFYTIGQSFSASIDRARLFDAEREQRNVAETLREIGIRLASSLEMEQILDELLNQITRLIPYDTGNLMLVSGDWASISRLRGYEKFGDDIARQARFRAFRISETSNLRTITETKRPLIISDVKNDPGWIEYGMSNHIRSWIGAPIIAHDEVIAIFSLDKITPNYYQRIHLDRLAAFTAQAGLALENARLYARLREDLNREQRFHQLTQAFSTGLDLKTTAKEAVRLTMEILNADAGSLSLFSENKEDLIVEHSINMPPLSSDINALGGTYVKKGEGVAWETINSKHSLLLNLERDPQRAPHLSEVGVRSMISVPVLAGENYLGALGVFSYQQGKPFNERDLAFTESIGRQTGIAIQNIRLFDELHRLAITDPLTGIFNRGQFFTLGVVEVERSSRYEHFLSAVMLDIDHFKQINDTYGHAAGDQVLQEIARRCNAVTRMVDILGRYGGEEFAILLPETDLVSAAQAAERLREDIETRPFLIPANLSISITASIGVTSIMPQASYGETAVSQLEILLAQADEAMYEAKRNGRNLVRAFNPDSKAP